MNRENKENFHALKFITDNCTGCTHCVRVCPTGALRVRNGKVAFESDRCIDCGKCIRACTFDAIKPLSDKLSVINKFKYKIAILSTTYAGQFPSHYGYKKTKKALLRKKDTITAAKYAGFVLIKLWK